MTRNDQPAAYLAHCWTCHAGTGEITWRCLACGAERRMTTTHAAYPPSVASLAGWLAERTCAPRAPGDERGRR